MRTPNQYWQEILAFSIAFITPIFPTMLAIGFLLMTDFFTGIWAAYKANEKITSRKMGTTISKIILYNIAIITCAVTEKYLVPQIPFTSITAGVIGLVELKSLTENVYKATGLNLWDTFKEYLSRIKK